MRASFDRLRSNGGGRLDKALPTLYSFRRCPYAMRARMALRISGLPVELREVKLSDKPAELLKASPKGTVPVLVLSDGTVIDESLDIMHHALAAHDPEGWLERNDPALIAANDGPFKYHLDRYKYHWRHETDPAEHREAGLGILRDLESRLEHHANLCGDQRGLADIATFPFIRQFAHTDREWFAAQPLPRLQHWLEAHLASELFAAVMQKHPVWQPGDPPVTFAAD